jgi:hypothetical protein
MFEWLKSGGKAFSKKWKTWQLPTKILIVLAILALIFDIGFNVGQYFGSQEQTRIFQEQTRIQQEALDLEKSKNPNIVPAANLDYFYSGAKLKKICEEDDLKRCSILEELQIDKNYQGFYFSFANLGASTGDTTIEINPPGQTRIVLIRGTGVRSLDVTPFGMEYNTPKGPTINMPHLEKYTAFGAEVFIESGVPVDINWNIKIESKNPDYSSCWYGPVTTKISLTGGAVSQIKKTC